MATVAITPDQDTVEAEIFIAAPPERVFQAWIDPQQDLFIVLLIQRVGLPNVPVNYVRLQPGKSDTLFAATFGRGVWSYVFKDGPPVDVPTTPDVTATTRFGGAVSWSTLLLMLFGWRRRRHPV